MKTNKEDLIGIPLACILGVIASYFFGARLAVGGYIIGFIMGFFGFFSLCIIFDRIFRFLRMCFNRVSCLFKIIRIKNKAAQKPRANSRKDANGSP